MRLCAVAQVAQPQGRPCLKRNQYHKHLCTIFHRLVHLLSIIKNPSPSSNSCSLSGGKSHISLGKTSWITHHRYFTNRHIYFPFYKKKTSTITYCYPLKTSQLDWKAGISNTHPLRFQKNHTTLISHEPLQSTTFCTNSSHF